ncbi:MAG: hypothetical protein VKN72_12425 [Nostocales cyanobacterium 94392]|nr:hypothetical protein [Nostocales cyanobacterium 94392]
MSEHNENNWKEAAVNTAVAGAAFALGALVDEVVKAETGKKSESGKLAAAGFLAALHLNEASDIIERWTRG